MDVVLFFAQTAYETPTFFTYQLQRALVQLGACVRLLPFCEEALTSLAVSPPDWSCSFADLTVGGKALGLSVPWHHLSYLLDPCIYSLHQLQGERSHLSCIDQEETALLKEMGYENVLFLPHAASPVETFSQSKEDYPLVFFGSFVDPDEIEQEWKEKWSVGERELLFEAVEEVECSPKISILRSLLERGVSRDRLAAWHVEVDRMVRHRERAWVVKGCPQELLHIWGEGPWEKVAPGATVYPPCSFQEALNVMQRASIVVSASVRMKWSYHERLFYAPLQGALPLGSQNATSFGPTYTKQTLPSLIEHWLLSTELRQQEIEKLSQRVLEHHTWEERGKTLLRYFGEVCP